MRRVACALLLSGVSGLAANAEPVTLGDRTYELVGETWFFVDDQDESWEIWHGLMEVRFVDGVTESQRDSIAGAYGLASGEFGANPFEDYFRYTYGLSEDPIDLLSDVIACSLVADAELAWKIKPLGDPYFVFDRQWNAYLINLDKALQIPSGEAEVLLAIHDFGVDREHEDLVATVSENPNEIANGEDTDKDYLWTPTGDHIVDDFWGWDFDNWHDPVPISYTPHGTLVAGMAMAANDNDIGIASPGGGSATARPIRWRTSTFRLRT